MATIRDVATLAGVSTATVSHVLNDSRPVSEILRGRVQVAMKQLGYQPDAVARSLRRRQTLTIGLFVPSLEIPFYAWLAGSIGFRQMAPLVAAYSDLEVRRLA